VWRHSVKVPSRRAVMTLVWMSANELGWKVVGPTDSYSTNLCVCVEVMVFGRANLFLFGLIPYVGPGDSEKQSYALYEGRVLP
jgi:hypothetical protein